jgi:hypothetical protein
MHSTVKAINPQKSRLLTGMTHAKNWINGLTIGSFPVC